MLLKTKGIVLNRLKYSDTAVITTIYTSDFGKISFLVHGGNSKKSVSKTNLLQPLYLLDLELNYKENSNLQKVSEISIETPLKNISTSVLKQSITFFLAEFVNKCLKDNDKDERFFEYFRNSVIKLDSLTENQANFHIKFLLDFFMYTGIYPENNFSETRNIFDIEAGKFVFGRPLHKNFADIETGLALNNFLNADFDKALKLNITKTVRNNLILLLINYSNFHIEKPGRIKSLEILKEVFS